MAKKKRIPLADRLKDPLFWLLLITLLGGFFRFTNPDWDFQEQFHPDERNIMGAIGEINQANGYKTTFFAYGQLTVYLTKATGEIISPPTFWAGLFNGHSTAANLTYWLFLVGVWFGTVWFFSREKWKFPAFVASYFMFGIALFLRFSSAFNLWFGALEGQRADLHLNFLGRDLPLSLPILPVAGFIVVAVTSLGISALLARLLEVEWFDLPLYIAVGTLFLFGIVPAFFPQDSHLPVLFSALFFFLLVAILAAGLAWVSRWGRVALAGAAVWTLFASLPHGGAYNGEGDMLVIGRVWSAFFSAATIPALYFLVKRIYKDVGMALVAAAAFAFAVGSIENAHYAITESVITFLLVAVAYFSGGIIKDGGWKNYLAAGAAFGFALAAKTSALYYVLIIGIAHLFRLSQKSPKEWEKEGRKLREDEGLYSTMAGGLLGVILLCFWGVGWQFKPIFRDLFLRNPGLGTGLWVALFLLLGSAGSVFFAWGIREFRVFRAQMPEWTKLMAAGGLAFFIFFLFSPWNLLDYRGFLERQNYEWSVVSIADAPYTLQFRDTPRYLYQLQNLVTVELWWPLGILVLAGTAWVLGRFLFQLFTPVKRGYLLPLPFSRGRGFAFSQPDLLLLLWFIAYFGFIGAWNTKFVRYMAPLIPVFCLFGARFLADLFQWLKPRFSGINFLKPAVLAVVLGASLFYSVAYMHVYFYPHPWIDDSVWIFQHVPKGSVIGSDVFDDGMPVNVDPNKDSRMDRPRSPAEYGHQEITPYENRNFGAPKEQDIPDQRKQKYYADILQKCDYISLATKKLWYTLTDASPEFRPNGFDDYPVTSRYYRLLWSGLLGYKMVAEFHNFPGLLGWEHPDDWAEETFSVYDHPRTYLFKKVETVPPEQIIRLLSSDDYVKGINRDVMRTITPDNVDDFIAARKKYLEDNGLLKQLDEAPTPVPTP